MENLTEIVNLKVEIDQVKSKNGKSYNNYVVKGKVIGRNGGEHEGRARLVPYDVGGYSVLDLLFDGSTELTLSCVPFTSSIDGKDITGVKYLVQDVDDNGEILNEVQLKPFQRSDKDWLEIFCRLAIQNNNE